MKRFHVTFGMGTILRGYHCIVEAQDELIVRVWFNKLWRGTWCSIYETEPAHSIPLRGEPEKLCYVRWEDI